MIKNYLKLLVALVFATNVMAQNVPSYVPKDGLVGWWPFNGNANDESGNGNNGTVNGATLTSDRNGKANSAYRFNGDSKITINNKDYFNLNANFSINCWLNAKYIYDTPGYLRTIISKHVTGDASNGFVLNVGPYKNGNVASPDSGSIRFQASPFYNEITNPGLSGLIIKDKWYNICVNYNDKKLNYFLNSTLIYSTTIDYNLNKNNYDLIFGSEGGHHFFNGNLDDITIYNRALSEQEVKQLYEGCAKENATSNSFNSYAFTNNSSINLTATPTGGTFTGEAVTNNTFNPSKGKLGKNQVKYTFKNSTGCADSTNFEMILVDTLGNKCSTYDTLKIKVQLTTGIKAGQIATMNVYPNPTSDFVIIETSDVAALNGYSYKMVDLQGKQVYKELVTKSKTEISLKSIGAKGVYILHVVDAQGVSIENKKIVLE